MIYRSFYRKKSTKIYLGIITIVISLLMLLSCFVNYYNDLVNDLYSKRTIFVIESDNNSYDLLSRYSFFSNISRIVLFSQSSNMDVIVWPFYEFGTMEKRFVASGNEDLADDEIEIGIPETYFNGYDNKEKMNNTINSTITLYFDGNPFIFKIKSYYSSKTSEVRISQILFESLLQEESKYTYIADVNSYNDSQNVKTDLLASDKLVNAKVLFDTCYYNFESNTIIRLNELISLLTFVTIVIIILFGIFLLVVTKNQINDLQKNVILERKLGYSRKKIKINLFIRILSLYIISVIFAVLLSFIILKIINFVYKIEICFKFGIF